MSPATTAVTATIAVTAITAVTATTTRLIRRHPLGRCFVPHQHLLVFRRSGQVYVIQVAEGGVKR